MGKLLYSDPQAEQEANDIAFQFMDSRDVMGDMGRAYHTDFSSVSIHTDESAAEKTAEAGVDAFASGRDIFFGRDAFDQNDPAGRGLLAHELVHTMQQDAGAESVQSAAPAGAEQGGILDWFRSRFGRKKISKLGDAYIDKGDKAREYRQALEPVRLADRIRLINQTATPEAHIGQGGDAKAGETFASSLKESGFIEASNQTLRDYGGRENSAARLKALASLGIRNSSNASTQAEKTMRGNIYEGLTQNYANWMYDLQNSGLDMGGILQNGKIDQIKTAGFATGGGYDALSNKAMDMFSEYVLSDQSLDYIRQFSSGVAPADVFGGQMYGTQGATSFALQTLVNTVGATVFKASLDERLGDDSRQVAKQVGRTIGSLPTLSRMPDEEIPKSLIPLRDRYLQLQSELDKRLQEMG